MNLFYKKIVGFMWFVGVLFFIVCHPHFLQAESSGLSSEGQKVVLSQLVSLEQGEKIKKDLTVDFKSVVGVVSPDCKACEKQWKHFLKNCPEVLEQITWLGVGVPWKLREIYFSHLKRKSSVYFTDFSEVKHLFSATPSYLFPKIGNGHPMKMIKGYQGCESMISLIKERAM
jgi:hypothetical protein